MRTSFIIDLSGNLESRARRYTQSLGRFSNEGRRHLNSLSRAAAGYNRTLDRIGNKYTALFSGAAIGLAVRQVGNFNDRILRLGIQAGVTDDKLEKLKANILDVAQDRDILVDPDQILTGLNAIVEKTGDLEFAEKNIRNIGLAIQATGAQGSDIGDILAEFQKMGIIDPKQVMEAMDVLNVQGKQGAFTLQNIAALGPRVISAYTKTGRSGVDALREMGAALQVVRQGTGSSEQAATAFEAVINSITDGEKLKKLQALGISVFDPDTMRKSGERAFKPINEIMAEIITKTDGDLLKIGTVFDSEAMRAFNASISEFKRTGAVGSLQKFYEVQADGTQTTQDARRGATSFAAALSLLSTAGMQFADSNLAEPIKEMAQWLNSIEPGTVQRWLEIGKQVALLGGGLVLASKARRMLGTTARGGAGGRAGLGGAGAPIPVYIVGGPGAMTGAAGATGATSKLGKAANIAGKGLVLGEAAMAGYAVGTILNEAVINPLASFFAGRDATLGTLIGDALHGDSDITAPVTRQEVGGMMEIKITDDRARVTKLEQKGGMTLAAETGSTMGDL